MDKRFSRTSSLKNLIWKENSVDTNTCIDFGRSFLCSNGCSSAQSGSQENDNGPINNVRFWVESALRIFDDHEDTAKCIYQCGCCKAENTFDAKGPGDLFMQPNYDFIPVLHGDEILIFRRWACCDDANGRSYTTFEARNPLLGSFTHNVVETKDTELLDSFEKIVQASNLALPMVGKTLISNSQTQLRAEIQYPVKTLNIHYDPDIYQVDTGPLLFPDISRRCENWGQQVSLAFVAYDTKTKDSADFIIEAPVPIVKDGREICRVMHYSETISCEAQNSLWGLR